MSVIRYNPKQITFQVTPANYNKDHQIEAIDQISGKVITSLISKEGFMPFGESIPSINRFYIIYCSSGIQPNTIQGKTPMPVYTAKIFCAKNESEILSCESRYYVPAVFFDKNRVVIISRIADTILVDRPSIINYKAAVFSLGLLSDDESVQSIFTQISIDYAPDIILKEGIIGLVYNSGHIAINTINQKNVCPNYVAGVFWLDDGEKIVSRNSINYIPRIYFPFSEIEIVGQTNGSTPIIERVRFDIYGDFLWSEVIK